MVLRGVLWVVLRGVLWVVLRGVLWVVLRGVLWVVLRVVAAGSHWALVAPFESHWLVILALDGQNVVPFLGEEVALPWGES